MSIGHNEVGAPKRYRTVLFSDERIAKALRDSRPKDLEGFMNNRPVPMGISNIQTHKAFQWFRTVLRMADMCETDNPNFDRSRFLDACGWEEV